MNKIIAFIAALLLLAATFGLSSAANAVTSPGVPEPCTATAVDGGYEVTWTRPTDDGGAPIWSYALKVKGQPDPVVRFDAENKQTESTARSYVWTGPVSGDPVTFQVRAINSSGFGNWCEAAVGSTPPPPDDRELVLNCPEVAEPYEGLEVTCVYEYAETTEPTPTPTEEPTTEPTEEPTTEPSPDPEPDSSLPYSAGSFFKSGVKNAPVNAARTTEFRNFMTTFADQKDTAYPLVRGVGGNNWGTPFAKSTASDPVWKLKAPSGYTPSSKVAFLGTTGFHAPSNLGEQLTGTSDSPFIVYDTVGGFSVMAANAEHTGPNEITADAWSVMYHTSNGLDYRNPLADDPRNFTSRGRITDAMVIRRDAFDKALANGTGLGHVLHMFIAESKSADGHVHPMTGHESDKNGFGAQGERIRIKPGIDLTTRGLSDFGLVIARTLQENGMYIGDNSGGASGVKAEMSPGAWTGVDGANTMHALQGLTWNDFEVVEQGWQ